MVSVLSPIVAITMIGQGILMMLKDKLGKFSFFIHILVVLVSSDMYNCSTVYIDSHNDKLLYSLDKPLKILVKYVKTDI